MFVGRGQGQEVPLLGEPPKLEPEWVLFRQATNLSPAFSHYWAVFTNSQSGDQLSFDAKKYGNDPISDPNLTSWWGDAANGTFPGGFPNVYQSSKRYYMGVSIRLNIVELDANEPGRVKPAFKKALEYSQIYVEESGTNHLAHGYAFPLGSVVVFVQNTSLKAITPDLAHNTATELISLYLKREAARRLPPSQPRAH